MTNFIEEGGWGMYPVLIFGLAAFAVGLWQVVSPKRDRIVLAGWLMGLTTVAGVLGTATGVQTSARYIGQVAADKRWIFLIGLDESLNNLISALVLVALTMLLMMFSHLRPQRGEHPALAGRRSKRDREDDQPLLRAV
jgi:hypothetical protein